MLTRATLLAALLLATTRAHADPPRATLTLAVDAAPLRAALRDLLDRVGVAATFFETPRVTLDAVLSQPARGDLAARVWIDLPAPAQARLFVLDAAGDRVFVRSFALDHGLDEVARETLAHVVADAVDALAHGAVIGVHRDTLRPVTPPPPPPPSPAAPAAPARTVPLPRGWRAHVMALGEAQLRGPALAAGASASLGVSWPVGAWRFGARATGRYAVAASFETAPFALRTSEVALRAMAFAQGPRWGRLALEGALGAGVDLVAVSAFTASDAQWVATPAPLFAAPVARAELVARVALGGAFALVAGAAVEAELSASRYVATRDGAAQPVLAPWPLRPSLTLGVEGMF